MTANALRITPTTLADPLVITPQGYKHAASVCLAAAAASGRRVALSSLPKIADTRIMLEYLRLSGAYIYTSDGAVVVDSADMRNRALSGIDIASVHGPLYFVPALAGRFGFVDAAAFGGCRFSESEDRPISHICSVLEAFGAVTTLHEDHLTVRANGLMATRIDVRGSFSESGTKVTGPFVSGATKAAILCAQHCASTSFIAHPYRKADVQALLDLLRGLGHAIEDANDTVSISPTMKPHDASLRVPDCITDVITWITIAVVHQRKLRMTLHNASQTREQLAPELAVLDQMGIKTVWNPEGLRLDPPDRILPVDLVVESDGVFSDHQPFFALLMLGAGGASTIRDRVWPLRFDYVRGLRELGARIDAFDGWIRVHPSAIVSGNNVVARDLRAAAVLLIAAMSARESVVMEGAHHLDRGYEALLKLLRENGAKIDELDACRG